MRQHNKTLIISPYRSPPTSAITVTTETQLDFTKQNPKLGSRFRSLRRPNLASISNSSTRTANQTAQGGRDSENPRIERGKEETWRGFWEREAPAIGARSETLDFRGEVSVRGSSKRISKTFVPHQF